MDHAKNAEPYSGELTTAAAVAERQAEAKEIAESIAGTRSSEPSKASRYSPVTAPGSATRGVGCDFLPSVATVASAIATAERQRRIDSSMAASVRPIRVEIGDSPVVNEADVAVRPCASRAVARSRGAE